MGAAVSRPQVWTGTAWKDAKFWTGTEWKQYTPAEYGNQLSWGMTNASDAPSAFYVYGPSNGYRSGYAFATNEPGLLSAAQMGKPIGEGDLIDVDEFIGDTIRFETRLSWVQLAGSPSGTYEFRMTASMDYWAREDPATIVLNQAGTGWGWSTIQSSQGVLNSGIGPRAWSFSLSQNTADLNGLFQGELRCDWARWWNVTRGEVLRYLSVPAWEPQVWDGSKWT